MKTAVFRADASPAIGAGHVMRCLALAEAWMDCGGKAVFLCESISQGIEKRLLSETVSVNRITHTSGSISDAEHTARIASEMGAAWVITDGYQFDGQYQEKIKNAGLHLLFLDDNGHATRYSADIVLNQNSYADMSLYSEFEPHTSFLLGSRYALIRKEFLFQAPSERKTHKTAHNILITLGGSDPDNTTGMVLTAIQLLKTEGLKVIVVVGSLNPHLPHLRALVKNCPNITLLSDVEDMPALMAWADLAISAGGSTCWELAFMGLPTCIITIADNQRKVAKNLQDIGFAENLGWYSALTPQLIAGKLSGLISDWKKRAAMSMKGRALVDGNGARCVIHAMSDYY